LDPCGLLFCRTYSTLYMVVFYVGHGS